MKGVMKGEKSCKKAKGREFDNVPKNLNNNKASWVNFIFHEILFEESDDSHTSLLRTFLLVLKQYLACEC